PEILSVEFLRKGDGTIPIPEPDDPEVVAFLQQGELLQAIKAYRARHQCSYEEGRAMVEAIQARMDF
ncbi:MAG TPA: hypothetical protein PK530_13650, partial [Anaerolineales bacterium]|nr:hypothetical protein [Anaerolineales bacterium]